MFIINLWRGPTTECTPRRPPHPQADQLVFLSWVAEATSIHTEGHLTTSDNHLTICSYLRIDLPPTSVMQVHIHKCTPSSMFGTSEWAPLLVFPDVGVGCFNINMESSQEYDFQRLTQGPLACYMQWLQHATYLLLSKYTTVFSAWARKPTINVQCTRIGHSGGQCNKVCDCVGYMWLAYILYYSFSFQTQSQESEIRKG